MNNVFILYEDELNNDNNFFGHVGFNLIPKHINLRFFHIHKILN